MFARSKNLMQGIVSDSSDKFVNITKNTFNVSNQHVNVLVVILILACVFYKNIAIYMENYLDNVFVRLIAMLIVVGLTFASPMCGVLFAVWYVLSVTHVSKLNKKKHEADHSSFQENSMPQLNSTSNPYFDLHNGTISFDDVSDRVTSKKKNTYENSMSPDELNELIVNTNDDQTFGTNELSDFVDIPRNIHNEPDGLDNSSGYATF